MPRSDIFKFVMNSKLGTSTYLNSNKYLYFGGAGYYLLQSHPEVIQAAVQATLEFGIGTATSRTISGTTDLQLELEQLLADFFETEDAAYLPSGYLSNIAGFQSLNKMRLFDVIFIDENAHYCNIDGAIVSGKKVIKFKHSNNTDLENKLKKYLNPGEKPLIATDGLFPIQGEIAPVNKYLQTAEQYNGIVWVDDSHAVGLLGQNGRGTYEYFDLHSDRLFAGATLSKAFGAYGGFIIGNSEFIKYVKNGNVFKGSSSPPNASTAAAITGIRLLKAHPEWKTNLQKNALYLKKEIAKIGIAVKQDFLPIVTFKTKDVSKMEIVQAELMKQGVFIQFVKYIGSGNDGILRIVLNAFHTKDEIDLLVRKLNQVI